MGKIWILIKHIIITIGAIFFLVVFLSNVIDSWCWYSKLTTQTIVTTDYIVTDKSLTTDCKYFYTLKLKSATETSYFASEDNYNIGDEIRLYTDISDINDWSIPMRSTNLLDISKSYILKMIFYIFSSILDLYSFIFCCNLYKKEEPIERQ